VTGYHPMTLAELGQRLARTADAKVQWKLVWEFLEEYRWEPAETQPSLLQEEPTPVGDERWDALLAALAEHLAARLDLAPLTFLDVPGQVGSGSGKSGGAGMAHRPLQSLWPGGCCHRHRWCADL
jgi:hypothetical protein